MVEAAVIEAVGVDQAEDLLAVGTKLLGQMNLLGQMMKYEQGTVQLDLFHLGFAADIADMALDNLALDPTILDLGKIDAAPAFDLANEAHCSVHNIHYKMESTILILWFFRLEKPRLYQGF